MATNKKTLELVFEAMYHGKHDFNDFIRGDIARNLDAFMIGKRLIHKPNKKLKVYHSFLNLFLFEYLPINTDVVFSYRKGVNVYDAVSRHRNSRHFFQTDITNFFHSLNSGLVKKVIENGIDNFPVSNVEKYIDRVVDLVMVGGVLPMGFPTSPLLSNACLFEFDNYLQLHCAERGLVCTRYSDDIIVSSFEREPLSDIAEAIGSIMEKCFDGSLKINPKKSKFTHIGRKIKLLGMVVLPTGGISVDIKFKKEVEVLLHFYLTDKVKFLDKIAGDAGGGAGKISGYLSYINTVDPLYLDKLRKKYGATIVDMFLHKTEK